MEQLDAMRLTLPIEFMVSSLIICSVFGWLLDKQDCVFNCIFNLFIEASISYLKIEDRECKL